MEYVKFGHTGLDVSRLCLGCMTYGVSDRGNHAWTLDEATSRPLIEDTMEAPHDVVKAGKVRYIGASSIG